MSTSAYVTFDNINVNSGAGLVCYHEINALKKVTDCIGVVARKNGDIDINVDSRYPFNPFLYDYFASKKIPFGVDLLHISCTPAMAIINSAKPKHYIAFTAAHDLNETILEHEAYLGKGNYPYFHLSNSYLFNCMHEHMAKADIIICPSSTSKKWLEDNIRNYGIEVIPHGTEIPLNPAPLPILNEFRIGYLGAFGPDKGLPYLYNAIVKLGLNQQMIWGGNCQQAVNQYFPNSKTTGWLKTVDVFYNNISIYVQPSVTEGFGIEILEAMSYGRPVIASRGAGGADVITDGADGFIIKPRDEIGLAEKIQFFKDNPQKIIEMGNAAREKAKQYEWSKIEKKYEDVYLKVLGI